jgi:hypothetical protein
VPNPNIAIRNFCHRSTRGDAAHPASSSSSGGGADKTYSIKYFGVAHGQLGVLTRKKQPYVLAGDLAAVSVRRVGESRLTQAVSRRPPNPCSDPIVARTEGLHVRHESLGTRAIFCRAVPNLGHCYDSQLFRRCTPARRRVYSPLGGGRSGWPVVRFKMLSGPFTQPPFRPSPTLTAAAAPGGGNQRRYVPR